MPRIASIDIGTNTVLMLIADVDEDGTLTVVRDEHAIVRLGRNVDASGRIQPERIGKLVEQMASYTQIAERERCDRIIATGTSALRDASNSPDVLSEVEKKTGITIHILSADDEADLTYWGGVSDLASAERERPTIVLDIGGGSTEIAVGDGIRVTRRSSIDVGAVRMTERFWDGYPPSSSTFEECRASILNSLRNLEKPPLDATWIGVAGTVTTLAAIDLRVTGFDGARIHGHVLGLDSIRRSERNLGTLRANALAAHPSIHPDRADIIVAGILILDVILTWGRVESMRVSTRGLRYGSALAEAGRLRGRARMRHDPP